MQKAQQLQRPVFVYAYSPGCHFCQQMEKTTLRSAAVAAYYNATFVSVKVDVTVDTAFARRYDIHGFPTYLYFDSAGQPL
ncbi:thioredoxin family protein, partial [Rhizobium johnstonii]